MPAITILETTPNPDGTTTPATGELVFTPTAVYRGAGAGEEVLPKPILVELVNGAATVTLAQTGPGWAWRVDRRFLGVPSSTVYVQVGSAAANLVDLTVVNPASLTPPAAPAVSWDAAISQVLADPSTASSQSVHSTSAGLAAALSIVFGG